MDVTVADRPAAEPTAPPTPRRRWPGITVAALVAVVLATVFVLPHSHGQPRPPDARAVGLPLVLGDTLYLVDGRRVTLPLDSSNGPGQLEIVPAGYLYDDSGADDAGLTKLRLADRNGQGGYRDLGDLGDSRYRVTPDGRIAVAVLDVHGTIEMGAIDLATGKRLTNTTMGRPYIVDVNGDWALLDDGDSPVDARKSEVWNVRTGQVIRLPDPNARELGVLPTGRVFRGLDVPTYDHPLQSFIACYDTFAPAADPTTPVDGFCGPYAINDAFISPGGDWVFVVTPSQTLLLRISDLVTGRWAPVTFDPGGISDGIFWDSPTSLVMPHENGYERCTVTGRCQDLHLPVNTIVGQTLGS